MTVSPRILVVDDDRDIVRLLDLRLSLLPVEMVGHAYDGRQAVEEALRLRPDVVVMDQMLPVMDGAEATRRIIERLPRTVVLGFTAADGSAADELRAAGATGVFDKTQLMQLIDTIEALAG